MKVRLQFPCAFNSGSKVPIFLRDLGIINQRPFISPTIGAQICCQVPTKSPIPPPTARGPPPLGEDDDKCIIQPFCPKRGRLLHAIKSLAGGGQLLIPIPLSQSFSRRPTTDKEPVYGESTLNANMGHTTQCHGMGSTLCMHTAIFTRAVAAMTVLALLVIGPISKA